jgi:hypothetical protein
MDEQGLLAMFRGIERLVIELGAITTIVMGTLLYRWGIQGAQEVEASASGFSFKLKNAAPGSVLALFGMVVLVVGLRSPLELSRTSQSTTQVQQGAKPQAGQPGGFGDGTPKQPGDGGPLKEGAARNAESPGGQAATVPVERRVETTAGTATPAANAATATTTTTTTSTTSATYASLPDAVRQEIDSLGSLRNVPKEHAAGILQSHQQTASELLKQKNLPAATRSLLQRVLDGPVDADPVVTLNNLASAARRTKAGLSSGAAAAR